MIFSLPGITMASIPAWLAGIFFLLEMMFAAHAGLWLFNRRARHTKVEQNNEVAAIIFGAIGLIYSLILAFVIVAVWEDYNGLNKTIETETDKLNSILAHSSTLQDNLKEVIGTSMNDYCNQVIDTEWQMQERKTDHPSAMPGLRLALLTTQPENNMQERVFDVIDEDLGSISDLHRERLTHTHSQMPQLIWLILKAGTVILILFSYFFYVPSARLKRVYLTFLVTSVSMCMFLVYSLDHPFDGRDGVSNQPYRNVQDEIKAYLPVAEKWKRPGSSINRK